ncbi:MAG: CcmD family protein [Candidatus Nitrohelix vancouverensis]|uniref:CcmD family protein n=1 Tax=Candidatus Nitrohelix vancouverensis TaxID=2705534 RepID=A0A7T0C4X1_9BACT|nr:MAG: CcmD family protein [Candidatus Nitrohelix vancouverensis]
MNSLGYLFAANVCVWGGIFFYVLTLSKRQSALRKDLALLQEDSRKDGS